MTYKSGLYSHYDLPISHILDFLTRLWQTMTMPVSPMYSKVGPTVFPYLTAFGLAGPDQAAVTFTPFQKATRPWIWAAASFGSG